MKLSVVIATFNQRDFLRQALQSVLGQSQPVHEVIVVDDGSTDGTADMVRREFAAVTLIEQPNLGKGIARNTGIFQATGEWIGLLDHDDLWHREKAERLSRIALNFPTAVAFGHPSFYFTDDPSKRTASIGCPIDFVADDLETCQQRAHEIGLLPAGAGRPEPRLAGFGEILDRQFFSTSAQVVRRDIAIRAGGFSPMQFNGEDWSFALNVARFGPWCYFKERLTFMRSHAASGTKETGAGLMLLASYVNAWYAGRPLQEHTSGLGFVAELANRRVYRGDAQALLWNSIRAGQFRMARLIYHAACMLLPRLRDRFYLLCPPPISWRFERYILGMHK